MLEEYSKLDAINTDKIVVEKITEEKLNTLINNRLSLIHIWGSWCTSTVLGLDKIRELIDNNKNIEIILIAADISSKEQVDIIKKILALHNIRIKTYILENDLGTDVSKIKNFMSLDHIYNIVHSFDKNYKKIEVENGDDKMYFSPIPYTSIINKNKEVIFSQIPQIDLNNKSCPDKSNYYNLKIDKIIELIKLNNK